MLPENGHLQVMRRQNWTMKIRRESGGGVGKPVTWAAPITAGSLENRAGSMEPRCEVAAVVSNWGGRGSGGGMCVAAPLGEKCI